MVENVGSGGERYRSSGGHMCCPVPDQLVSRLAHYICGRHLPSLMSYLGAHATCIACRSSIRYLSLKAKTPVCLKVGDLFLVACYSPVLTPLVVGAARVFRFQRSTYCHI